MKRGYVLKQFLQGMGDPSGLYVAIDEDFNSIKAETAVDIWEKLNEEIPEAKKPVLNWEIPEEKKIEKKKTEKAEKTVSVKVIDDGKIRALKNAGWSVPKIADEMRCSEVTIYNHLKKMGYKEEKE